VLPGRKEYTSNLSGHKDNKIMGNTIKKESFVVDFALGDLIELLREAGFSWSQGPRGNLGNEHLDRFVKKYNLPEIDPGTKGHKILVEAIRVVLRFTVDVIRFNLENPESIGE
jgi:hypothetical protein